MSEKKKTNIKPLLQSETQTIQRSQIKLNPLNPKRHTEEKIKEQCRNFKKYGYLGGIVWNKSTGNLIDGHRRIEGMDLYYKYDGAPETDYSVKIEVVQMDEKAEKEQMTYMALANTRADYDLIAEYAPSIDYKNIGLPEMDVQALDALLADQSDFTIPEVVFSNPALEQEAQKMIDTEVDKEAYEERKADIMEKKQRVAEGANESENDSQAFVTLSFSDFDAFSLFCDLLGTDPYTTKYIKGEEVLSLIE